MNTPEKNTASKWTGYSIEFSPMKPIQLPSEDECDSPIRPQVIRSIPTSDFKIDPSSVIESKPTVVHPKPKPKLKKSKTHGTNQITSLQRIDENCLVIKDS